MDGIDDDPMQPGCGRRRPSARRVPVRPVRVDDRSAEGDQSWTTRTTAADTPDS